MLHRLTRFAAVPWLVALLALAILSRQTDPAPGWDDTIFPNAQRSLALHHDPYQDSLRASDLYMQRLARAGSSLPRIPCVNPTCPYVYSPATLPLVRATANLPAHLLRSAFLALYTLCAFAVPFSLLYAARPGTERDLFLLLAPGGLFFAGLVLDFIILSGNIAYLLYGFVFPFAVLGWKRQRWLPFYVAVLLASAFKLPLLTLLAIPTLSSKTAWRSALLTGCIGLFVFGLQARLWPSLFHNYLQVLDRLFRQDRDFGFSPAGLFASFLHLHHRSYSPGSTLAYLAYALVLVAVLLRLRGRYLTGNFTQQSWIPVLLLGTLLLNPRIKEYDIAAFTLPMALIAWRALARNGTFGTASIQALLFLTCTGALVHFIGMQTTYGLLLPALFATGVWQVVHVTVPRVSAIRPTRLGFRLQHNRKLS